MYRRCFTPWRLDVLHKSRVEWAGWLMFAGSSYRDIFHPLWRSLLLTGMAYHCPFCHWRRLWSCFIRIYAGWFLLHPLNSCFSIEFLGRCFLQSLNHVISHYHYKNPHDHYHIGKWWVQAHDLLMIKYTH